MNSSPRSTKNKTEVKWGTARVTRNRGWRQRRLLAYTIWRNTAKRQLARQNQRSHSDTSVGAVLPSDVIFGLS